MFMLSPTVEKSTNQVNISFNFVKHIKIAILKLT